MENGGKLTDEEIEARMERAVSEALESMRLPGDSVKVEVGEGRVLGASRAMLEKHCEFFRALFSFREDSNGSENGGDKSDRDQIINLSCDVPASAMEWAVLTADRDGAPPWDVASRKEAYEVLRACAYLQCTLAEKLVASAYLGPRLAVANCFFVLCVARESACGDLFGLAHDFALKRLRTHLFRPVSVVDQLLALDCEDFQALLVDHVPDNELAFWAVLGWVRFDMEGRRHMLRPLLDAAVTPELLDADAVSGSEDVAAFFSDKDLVGPAVAYRELSLQERVDYWSNRPRPPKWPMMHVVCSTGYFEPSIVCSGASAGPGEGRRWRKLTMKPERLLVKSLGSSFAAVGSTLYFFGGDGNDVLWTYDLTSDSWKVVGPGAQDGDDGGSDDEALQGGAAAVAAVDGPEAALPLWRQSYQRIRPAVAALGRKIYVFGGSNPAAGALDTAECYDVDANSWTTLMPLSAPRTGAVAAAHGGRVFLFGGMEKRRHATTTVEAYDPATGEYSEVASLPRPVLDFGLCLAGRKAYLMGGLDPLTFTPVSYVFSLDLETFEWEELPELPVAKKSSACFFDGVRINSCGGSNALSGDSGDHRDSRNLSPTPETSLVHSFDFDEGAWKSSSQLPKVLNTPAMAAAVDVPVRLMGEYADLGASNFRVQKSKEKKAKSKEKKAKSKEKKAKGSGQKKTRPGKKKENPEAEMARLMELYREGAGRTGLFYCEPEPPEVIDSSDSDSE